MKRRLIIFDTTLREGEQAPGCNMSLSTKVNLAKMLDKVNVDIIEAGFAAASPGEVKAIRAVAKAVERPIISSLCRAIRNDIDVALMALEPAIKPRVHIVLATSDIHLKYKLKMTRRQVRKMLSEAVYYASQKCVDVQFTAEDAGRTNIDFLCDVVSDAIKSGAMTVNLSDTVGYRMPEEFGQIIREVRDKVKEIHNARLSVHVHNDLGMALASTLAAVEAGIDQAECTVNGIGERAGICALEELVTVIKKRQDYFTDIFTDIKEEELYPLSRALEKYTGFRIPYNKPVVGRGARGVFDHNDILGI